MFKFFSELSDENRVGFRTIKIMVFINLIFGFWGISNDSYAETLSHKHSSKHTHHAETKKNISKHKVKKASQSTHQKKHPHTKATAHTNKQPIAAHHGNNSVTHTHSVQKPSEPVATPIPSPAPQEQPKEPDKGSVTGQPLPRFSALRADEVNMRAGPGMNYPILWVYHRRSMPVKILREFDVWRLIEDQDGQKGWVQGATLVGNRTFIVKGSALTTEDAPPPTTKTEKKENEHTDSRIIGYISDMEHEGKGKDTIILRKEANDASLPIAVLKPGVVGLLKLCPTGSDWCKVSVKQYSGWLRRDSIWGLLPQEVIQSP